jgi:hypothetical protein
MRIRGPYPLFNPLSIGELGLQGIGTALQVYNAYNQGKAMDFAENAALTGQPATSLPGGAIRHFLSTITGGAVSPTEDINGQGALAQNAILSEQAKTKLAEVGELTRARASLGPDSFAPGTPLGDAAKKGFGLDLSNPTPLEDYRNKTLGLNQKKTDAYVNAQNPQTKINTAAAVETAKKDVDFSPGVMSKEVQLAGEKGAAEGAAHAKAALDVNSSPLAMATKYNAGFATRSGGIAGAAQAYQNMPVSQYQAVHKSTFVDRDTLSEVKSGKAGDFLGNPDKYQEIPVTKIPDLNKDKSALANVQRVKKLILDHPEYFPSVDKSNAAARFGLGHAVGIENTINASTDPNIKAIQSTITNLSSYLRDLNGRSPNASQMTYDANVLIPSLGGYGSRADSQAVALDKLDRLSTNIKGLYGGTDDSAGPSDDDVRDGISSEIVGTP